MANRYWTVNLAISIVIALRCAALRCAAPAGKAATIDPTSDCGQMNNG